MIASEDLRLAQETARDLRAQGQEERARALEAVLAVATSALAGEWPAVGRDYLTTGQAARALGVSRQTIKNWVAAGQLQATRLGGRVLIHREALWAYLDKLRESRPPERVRTPEETEAARRQHEFIMAGLPADKLARLEALHDKMEEGQRLTRSERTEMVALERELTAAAGQRLEDSIAQSGSRTS